MRKLMISLAAAGAAIAVATPAAAQYYPGQPYGYGAPYGQPLKVGTKLEQDPEQAKIVKWILRSTPKDGRHSGSSRT